MKRNKRILIMTLLVMSIMCISTSCRNAGKYADDVFKYAYDVISGRKSIKPKPKRAPKKKDCGNCNGSGRVYIYGNWYECSNCNGDGKVWIN